MTEPLLQQKTNVSTQSPILIYTAVAVSGNDTIYGEIHGFLLFAGPPLGVQDALDRQTVPLFE